MSIQMLLTAADYLDRYYQDVDSKPRQQQQQQRQQRQLEHPKNYSSQAASAAAAASSSARFNVIREFSALRGRPRALTSSRSKAGERQSTATKRQRPSKKTRLKTKPVDNSNYSSHNNHVNRPSHNELEKNRRAHMKLCMEQLRRTLPLQSQKQTTQGLLTNAKRHIKALETKLEDDERECVELKRIYKSLLETFFEHAGAAVDASAEVAASTSVRFSGGTPVLRSESESGFSENSYNSFTNAAELHNDRVTESSTADHDPRSERWTISAATVAMPATVTMATTTTGKANYPTAANRTKNGAKSVKRHVTCGVKRHVTCAGYDPLFSNRNGAVGK